MLLQAIERKRNLMFETAKLYGMSSSKTIKCSQELDHLIQLQQNRQIRNSRTNYQKIS